MKLNITGLKTISVFRITVFLLISILFRNIILITILFLFCFIKNKYEAFIFLFLYLIWLFLFTYRFDYLPLGIVDYKNNSYVLVNKLFYKVKIYDETLNTGDIVIHHQGLINTNINELRKNIIYYAGDYRTIGKLNSRYLIIDRLNHLNDNKEIARSILFNTYLSDEYNLSLGYGLSSYYLLKKVKKNSSIKCILLLITLSILFGFEIKYLFIIIEILFPKISKDKLFAYKLLSIIFINYELIYNNSIIIPLLFSLYGIIDIGIDFKAYLLIIESMIFGNINLFSVFMFNQLLNMRIFIYLSSILILIFPFLNNLYLYLIKIFSFLNNIDFSIRGSIGIYGLLLLIYLIKRYNYNRILQFIISIFCIVLPLNNPFLHLSFIDVGQGDSILIKYPFINKAILIDTGSIYNYHKLQKHLYKEGIYEIEYLIISHDDSDHNGNIERLKKDFRIRNIVSEGKDIEYLKLKYIYLDTGIYDNDNDNSLVYFLNINGLNILFTGDASVDVERKLINKFDLNIDILKVGHHGSNTSSSRYFISNILPRFAIISTSGQYNHPSSEVLQYLDEYACEYFITKDDGTINIYFTKLANFIKTGNNDFVIIR